MATDPFEHVRSLFGEIRRALAGGRVEEAGQISMVAFSALQAFGATGALSDDDQQQLVSELMAMGTEFSLGDDAGDDAGDDDGAGSGRTAGGGSSTFMSFGSMSDSDPSESRSSVRLTSIAVPPEVMLINGDVTLDVIAVHIFEDCLEVQFTMHLPGGLPNAPFGGPAGLQERLASLRAQGLSDEEVVVAIREAMLEEQRSRDTTAGSEALRSWHERTSLEVAVADDVGTTYRVDPRHSSVGSGDRINGYRVITPRPPPSASVLSLTIHDHAGDPVARRTVPLH